MLLQAMASAFTSGDSSYANAMASSVTQGIQQLGCPAYSKALAMVQS